MRNQTVKLTSYTLPSGTSVASKMTEDVDRAGEGIEEKAEDVEGAGEGMAKLM